MTTDNVAWRIKLLQSRRGVEYPVYAIDSWISTYRRGSSGQWEWTQILPSEITVF
jgi:hypothetical protein